MKPTIYSIFACLVLFAIATACEDKPSATKAPVTVTAYQESNYQDTSLQAELLYDKILGALVGSAIGDAMGAPTEMWNRWQIGEEFGYVDSFDIVFREASPEGPWARNLPPGAGTDDTRWKELLVDYLAAENDRRRSFSPPNLDPLFFADFVSERYVAALDRLRTTEGLEPEPYEDNMRRMTWLQEWAKVSRAYSSGDIDAYRDALSKFYGGEMTCAGMLYAPVIGAFYPGQPKVAYEEMFRLSIFDIGYARDISGITSALSSLAFREGGLSNDSIKYQLITTDPGKFFDTRLLSRIAYAQFRIAENIYRATQKIEVPDSKLSLPQGYPYDSLTYTRTVKAYELLSQHSQDAPFHAGEIHLINLTALLVGELDFRRTIEFVVNYGRDNDTVAAITGAILGAHHGASTLPPEQVRTVLAVNRESLEIDLERLARNLADLILSRRPNDPASK